MYVPPAHRNGRFDADLTPMEVKGKEMEVFSSDEHPHATSLEKGCSYVTHL